MDRHWQLYHKIVENFTADNIDVDTMYEQLSDLENESRIEQVHIYTLKVPPETGEQCGQWINSILKKSQLYVDAQVQTISMSRTVIESESFNNATHSEQAHLFQDIIIREAPIGLFTANEISAILHYFTLPEDLPNDKDAQNHTLEH